MKTYNNWEEWMKETLNNEPVSYDEAHWLAAQKLLDELPQSPPSTKGGSKRFLWMWLLAFSGLLGSTGLWFAYSHKEHKAKENASSMAIQNPKTSSDERKTSAAKAHQPVLSEANTIPQPQNTPSHVVASPSKVLPSASSIIHTSSQKQPISYNGLGVVSNHINTFTSNPDNQNINNQSIDNQNTHSQSIENNPTLAPQEYVMQSQDKASDIQAIPSAQLKQDNEAVALSLQAVNEVSTPNRQPLNAILPIRFTPSFTLKNVALAPKLQVKEVNTLKKNRGDFYVCMGASMQKNSNVITPYLGVGYHLPFKHKLGLNVFTQYSQTANLAGIVKESHQIQYGLGLQQVTYQLTTQSLHFLEGGLGLTYQLKRHEIMGFAQAARLFYAKGHLETIESTSFGAKSQVTAPVSGYMEGLAKWDYGVGLGYAYSLNRNLQLRIGGYSGFNDLTNNAYYDNMLIHKNKQLRMGIVFRL